MGSFDKAEFEVNDVQAQDMESNENVSGDAALTEDSAPELMQSGQVIGQATSGDVPQPPVIRAVDSSGSTSEAMTLDAMDPSGDVPQPPVIRAVDSSGSTSEAMTLDAMDPSGDVPQPPVIRAVNPTLSGSETMTLDATDPSGDVPQPPVIR